MSNTYNKTLNISESLFRLDEDIARNSGKSNYANNMYTTFQGNFNVIPDDDYGINGTQMEVCNNQAKIANIYKNWGPKLLADINQYGVYPLGGQVTSRREGSLAVSPLNPSEVPKLNFVKIDTKNDDYNLDVTMNNYGIYTPKCYDLSYNNVYVKKN